jgi:2-phosphoglycerate kinase
VLEAEVGHRPRRSSYIKGVAGRDQHHVEPFALGFREHAMIVERGVEGLENRALKDTVFSKV